MLSTIDCYNDMCSSFNMIQDVYDDLIREFVYERHAETKIIWKKIKVETRAYPEKSRQSKSLIEHVSLECLVASLMMRRGEIVG